MKAPGSTRVLRGAAIATVLLLVSPSWALEAIGGPDLLGDIGPRIVAAEGTPGRNPLSSAAGYGQFLSGTWLEMFGRTYPQVARTLSREQILALRDVKPLAEDLTNRYAQANAATLRSLGLPAAAGELSLAHAIGPGGAVSVLTAEPARPAAELLRPEAIAANPVFRGMTASALRQWATTRVSAPPERAPSLQLLGSAADLRIEQPPKATEAPDTERNTSTVLKDVVEALSKVGGGTGAQLRPSTAVWLLSVGVEPIGLVRGDPGAVRIFNNAASRAVLDAVREVSDRPGFREFKAIETRAGSRGDLPRSVVRAVAIALLDKMNGESAVASSVARHRRSALKAPLGAADLSAPRPPQDAANADGRSADAPL